MVSVCRLLKLRRVSKVALTTLPLIRLTCGESHHPEIPENGRTTTSVRTSYLRHPKVVASRSMSADRGDGLTMGFQILIRLTYYHFGSLEIRVSATYP